MLLEPGAYDLPELSDRAGVSQRTVRYYIQQGLLPSPDARGPGSHYTPEHLDRLRLIKRLQREHLPLGEIRRRIERLTAAEVRTLLAGSPEPQDKSASEYIRSVLTGSAPPAKPPDALMLSLRSPVLREQAFDTGPSSHTRSQWDRFTLAPDVELHIRRPLSRETNRQIERLIEAARQIFEEES